MKKLLIIVSILGLFAGLSAQDQILGKYQTYVSYTGGTADTVNGASSWDYDYDLTKIAKEGPYVFSCSGDIDTLDDGGGSSYYISVRFRGSYDGVIYEDIGDSITFYGTQDTTFIANFNTYSEVTASHTVVTAAHAIQQDSLTVGDSSAVIDTVNVPQITQTVATQTKTITLPGYRYNFLEVLYTGVASSRYEIQTLNLSVGKLE